MITSRMKLQIALFLIIAITGVAYAGGEYAGLGRMFGRDGYRVVLQLADSGGIFTNAEVAYRGVPVGRVGQLHVTDSGVNVDLNLDASGPKIPAGTRAMVANRSAVGEQYVELEADHDKPPFLADGGVIRQPSTALPPRPENVLANLDGLVSSVPTDSLRTVVNELDPAFRAAGPDLQALMDNANSFVSTANQHVPQTRNLLSDARIVLQTQQQQANQIATFSAGLNRIAGQLNKSDPDIRNLLGVAPQVAQQVDDIVRTTGPQLSVLMANLLTTAKITNTRTAGLQQLLVTLPVATAFIPGLGDANDTGHQAFVMNFDDPLACMRGYEGTQRRPASDTSPAPANLNVHCAEPPGSPTDVRGSQNAPVGGKPVVVPPPSMQQPMEPSPGPQLPGAIGMWGAGGREARNMAQLLGLSG